MKSCWLSKVVKKDIDGLVGRGQVLLEKEEWDDAVTALEKVFESSEHGDREVSYPNFQVNKCVY